MCCIYALEMHCMYAWYLHMCLYVYKAQTETLVYNWYMLWLPQSCSLSALKWQQTVQPYMWCRCFTVWLYSREFYFQRLLLMNSFKTPLCTLVSKAVYNWFNTGACGMYVHLMNTYMYLTRESVGEGINNYY